MIITVSLVAGLYLVGCLLLAVFQDKLIYPGSITQGRPEAIVRESEATPLVRLTLPDRTPIVARFGSAIRPAGERLGVLFFYGNGTNLASGEGLVDLARGIGADVLMPEYPGYGMSGGKVSEAGIYATADAAYDHLIAQGIRPDHLIVVGWSLGGAAAIDLANRRPVGGLAAISTFTTMSEMARLTAPIFPTSLLLRSTFDSVGKIKTVTVPTLLVHGDKDTTIPAAMSHALSKAAGGPCRLVIVPGADHNDLYGVGYDAIRDALTQLAGDVRARAAK